MCVNMAGKVIGNNTGSFGSALFMGFDQKKKEVVIVIELIHSFLKKNKANI